MAEPHSAQKHPQQGPQHGIASEISAKCGLRHTPLLHPSPQHISASEARPASQLELNPSALQLLNLHRRIRALWQHHHQCRAAQCSAAVLCCRRGQRRRRAASGPAVPCWWQRSRKASAAVLGRSCPSRSRWGCAVPLLPIGTGKADERECVVTHALPSRRLSCCLECAPALLGQQPSRGTPALLWPVVKQLPARSAAQPAGYC